MPRGQHADALRVYHLALPAAEDAGSPRLSAAIGLEPTGHGHNQRRAPRLGVIALNAYRSAGTGLGNRTTADLLPLRPSLNSTSATARLRPLATEAATHDSTATDLAQSLRTALRPT
ncbi:MAG TPA: hypothetical protein VGD67_07220 [Pseudonocardiaceae bacterium]